jgi:hypothetical protein
MRLSALGLKRVILASFLSLSLINAGVLISRANTQSMSEPACKWSGETCPQGESREVCLSDGDGNTCTCGDVTRSCAAVEQ